jgi:hypothetical protein
LQSGIVLIGVVGLEKNEELEKNFEKWGWNLGS